MNIGEYFLFWYFYETNVGLLSLFMKIITNFLNCFFILFYLTSSLKLFKISTNFKTDHF